MRDKSSAHDDRRRRDRRLTPEGISVAGRHVLLVEDNFHIAKLTALILRNAGVEVVGPVGTVKDALALIAKAERIDGAALDINLRGETVYPVADALRSMGVPVLFTTGYDARSVKSGYTDVPCLQKPVPIERLIEALFG